VWKEGVRQKVWIIMFVSEFRQCEDDEKQVYWKIMSCAASIEAA
jgi:hypothetical protein